MYLNSNTRFKRISALNKYLLNFKSDCMLTLKRRPSSPSSTCVNVGMYIKNYHQLITDDV